MNSANKNAQNEALRLLDFLYENSGKRVILGQHTQTMAQEELSHIQDVTGELPALCGFELLGYSPNINYADADRECLDEVNEARGTLKRAWEWAEKGGILTFTWHWFSPLGGRDKSFFSRNTDFSAKKAVTEGTPEYKALISDMDYMAGLLKPFCDAHIPILWRPFHENEGDWFWWGKDGADAVRELYKLMFRRYVEHFKLNNLIWVFNSTKKECYPGDDYIDVISRDMYPPAHSHTSHAEELSGIKAFTDADKPFAIAETGTIPDVRAIIEEKLPWSWFMTWSKDFCLTEDCTTNEELKRAYSYENALTLGRFNALFHKTL